ncbi:dTDP-4-dehydrorhamnose 3,5-epimerase family protein [Arcanobacterium sp. S3PF19]|uniref:dTDP-4-dehydrorhamnose 3,5-epimerase family protein n=1 Tax=Arcanobacterium sp. S3PF19 TaxID=1219585 RepID=UPI0005104742|nr:dTDP-4-dehydrorhamnose 3,5-epimerase [Arcanobacterium sp. S3PF19]KGF05915.1 dTDP-4-dehydrorhamnose 3,5-epimerase [Arcanobacterium sp. S3PF19]
MKIRELKVPGAFEITPVLHPDARGVFLEAYKAAELEKALGHALDLKQANTSVSSAGVVRGIHFADVPPSQAKYVMCARGAVLDIAVDIRVGSPTFGVWDSVLLDDVHRRAIYLAEGLGHAFMALEDDSTVVYLCSEGYNPGREHGISPLDPTVGIVFPTVTPAGKPIKPLLSEKDTAAPTLNEAREKGLLPVWEECLGYYAQLNGK